MIKKFILLTTFYAVLIAGETPDWYYNIHVSSPLQIIGYGEANSLSKAKEQARDDIAKQIKTNIDSIATQSTHISGDILREDYKQVIKEKTIANLQGLKLLQRYQRSDGKYFVAIAYENIPFMTRFIKKLDLSNCKQNQNDYLKYTLLLSSISKITQCTPNINLLRNNETWYLVHQNTKEELPAKYFEKLYKSVPNVNINLKSSKNQLRDGDEFHLSLRLQESGYISLFDVYEDGTVSVLLPNLKVQKNKLINIPDKDDESFFVASLMKQGKPTFDLYVTIYSKNKIDISRFQQVNEDLTTGESNKKFDELVGMLNQHEFTTMLLRTLP